MAMLVSLERGFPQADFTGKKETGLMAWMMNDKLSVLALQKSGQDG